MQLHKTNKKAFFLLAFIVVYAIILTSLLYIVVTEAAKKQDLVGLKSINIIRTEQESQKIQLYLDLSSKLAYNKTLKVLGENGGYASSDRCEKTQQTVLDQEQYIIWNTCPILNQNAEFEEQFKKEIKNYINIYQSTYQKTNFVDIFNIEKTYPRLENVPENIKDDYNYVYTQTVKGINIIDIKTDKYVLVTFSDITLPIENDQPSYLTFKPKTLVNKPEFSIYQRTYLLVSNNCIKKTSQVCTDSIKKEFPNSELSVEDRLFKLKIPYDNYKIRIAFNIDQLIPSYQ